MKNLITIILIAISSFSNAQILEVDTIKENKLAKNVNSAKFFDNQIIAFCGTDNSVHFLSLKNLEVIKSFIGLKTTPYNFAISNNKKWIVACGDIEDIKVWDTKTGEMKHSIGDFSDGFGAPKFILFSPNDSLFAINRGCEFPKWDVETGFQIGSIPEYPEECNGAIAFTNNIEKVYCGGNSNVWTYNLKTKKIETVKNTNDISVVNDIVISPDGKTIAVAGRDGIMLLNNDLSDKLIFSGKPDWTKDISYSTDGKYLYSTGGSFLEKNFSVYKWDAETGNIIISAKSHTSDIESLDVSEDGRFIITASRDFSMKIWDNNLNLICTIVPMIIADKIEAFFYTTDGNIYGSEQFLTITNVKLNGEKISAETLKSNISKKNIIERLNN